jgi:hypothetical protein
MMRRRCRHSDADSPRWGGRLTVTALRSPLTALRSPPGRRAVGGVRGGGAGGWKLSTVAGGWKLSRYQGGALPATLAVGAARPEEWPGAWGRLRRCLGPCALALGLDLDLGLFFISLLPHTLVPVGAGPVRRAARRTK